MIPMQALLVPQFIIVKTYGWLNTYHGLIIPFISGSFGVFLMRQFFVTAPETLREAAKIEGCHEFQIYLRIYLPLSVPTLTTLAILKATYTWNDFLYPLIFTDEERVRTVQLALRYFIGQYSTPYNSLMAATMLISVPVIVLFFSLQKYYVAGLTSGSMKG
jgi:multiple sugar transport system permease protein